MRVGYDYVPTGEREALDRTADDFAKTMGYANAASETRESLLARTREQWVRELHEALAELLEPGRSVLSVGSGLGEHELPFHIAGYDVTASDIYDGALEPAAQHFPGFKTRRFDLLEPDTSIRYHDVVITSLDYALDDAQLRRALQNARRVLLPGGRLVFVQRYNDNLATKVIDRLLVPLMARAVQLKARLTKRGTGLVRRQHGYRRSRSEIVALAESSGYRVGRVAYAAFAMELARVGLQAVPPLFALMRRADRRLHVFNSATVFELIPTA